jgi:FAD/FMN-containing dehydrogenase
MPCYADLGPGGKDAMVLGPGPNQVTVNPGIREDELDAFLTQHSLMLDTVTAGGFFSIGGITAVDVHGATVDAPIFAEAVSAFTILGADGNEAIIDEQSTDGDGHTLLEFVRVSLGAFGHRDQNDTQHTAPALGEHAPRGNREIPAPHTVGFRCKVQRTVYGTDEKYPG